MSALVSMWLETCALHSSSMGKLFVTGHYQLHMCNVLSLHIHMLPCPFFAVSIGALIDMGSVLYTGMGNGGKVLLSRSS